MPTSLEALVSCSSLGFVARGALFGVDGTWSETVDSLVEGFAGLRLTWLDAALLAAVSA